MLQITLHCTPLTTSFLEKEISIEVPESFVHNIESNNMIIIYHSDGQEYVEIHSFKVRFYGVMKLAKDENKNLLTKKNRCYRTNPPFVAFMSIMSQCLYQRSERCHSELRNNSHIFVYRDEK